jgi:peptide-methionine (S)-S-oxide reductase
MMMRLSVWMGCAGAIALSAGALSACGATPVAAQGGETGARPATDRAVDAEGDKVMAEAMFGAGCFWSVEVAFRNTEGVVDVAVGYSGGHQDNPTYQQVCTGATGHAEVVHVKYDPEKVSYETLLETFWGCHDPTQLNRQGPDIGTQYRSAIFYYTPEQKEIAEASKKALDAAGGFARPIATEITEASEFWRGEEYHQRYLEKRGLATCRI